MKSTLTFKQSDATTNAIKQPDLLAAVADAAKLWRRAEKNHAMIVLGESKGNKTMAALAVEKQLHQLRIASDRYQAGNTTASLTPDTKP